jgi:hypothetical protein
MRKQTREITAMLPVLLLGLTAAFFIACELTEKDESESSDKEITAFSFLVANNPILSADVIGSISGTAIDLDVPIGTDVTGLVASFSTTGTGVVVGVTPQINGSTANNFVSTVVYTVTAGGRWNQPELYGCGRKGEYDECSRQNNRFQHGIHRFG